MNNKLNIIISAVSYSTTITLVDQLLRFFRSIILARILLPEHFGTFGIALTISASLQVLSNFGLKPRYLSLPPLAKDEETKWLESIWTMELVRGFAMCLILGVTARWFAGYFEDVRLFPVVLIMSLVPIVSGLSSPGMLKYEKILQYKKIATRELIADMSGFLITIYLAYLTNSAIALALGLLFQVITSLLLSFWLAPFKPRLLIDKQILMNCYKYGKHLIIVGVLTYITSQIDNLFVGKLSGAQALGFYIVAYNLAMTPVTLLVQIVSRVALPYYSEAWSLGQKKLAYQRWSKSVVITTFIVAGVTVALWSGRDYLIPSIYGVAWTPATPVFAVLLFVGLFRALNHTISPMLLAMERTDIDAKVKIVEAIIFVLLLYALVPEKGMIGAAYAGLASYMLAFFVRMFFFMYREKKEAHNMLKDYATCGLCLVMTIYLMEHICSYLHDILNIIVAFIMFSIICITINKRLRKQATRLLFQRE